MNNKLKDQLATVLNEEISEPGCRCKKPYAKRCLLCTQGTLVCKGLNSMPKDNDDGMCPFFKDKREFDYARTRSSVYTKAYILYKELKKFIKENDLDIVVHMELEYKNFL